jgi:hypothetical protein
MKIGIKDDCRHCGRPIALSRVRGRTRTWIPFERQTIPAAADAIDAYLPVTTGGRFAMVPISEIAPRHLEGIRWYAQRHRCAPYFLAKSAEHQARQAAEEIS